MYIIKYVISHVIACVVCHPTLVEREYQGENFYSSNKLNTPNYRHLTWIYVSHKQCVFHKTEISCSLYSFPYTPHDNRFATTILIYADNTIFKQDTFSIIN